MMAKVTVHDKRLTPSISCVPVNLVAFQKPGCISFCSGSLSMHCFASACQQQHCLSDGYATLWISCHWPGSQLSLMVIAFAGLLFVFPDDRVDCAANALHLQHSADLHSLSDCQSSHSSALLDFWTACLFHQVLSVLLYPPP